MFNYTYADDRAAIAARIAPIVPPPSASASATNLAPAESVPVLSQTELLTLGKKIYQKRCSFCHATGAAGAPKIGDQAGWQQRYAQGFDVLVQHVKKGYRLMPPKGTCMSCNTQDLQAAVKYLLQQSHVKES